MLTSYIQAAMRHATYEILENDEGYYGEIARCGPSMSRTVVVLPQPEGPIMLSMVPSGT